MARECLICFGTEQDSVFDEFGVAILRCRQCGHLFSSYDAEVHYDGYFGTESLAASEHAYWDLAHRRVYDHFGSIFLDGKEGKLLDLGCGLGFFVKRCQEKWPQWKVFACEISAPAVDYAKRELGLTTVSQGLVQEIGYEENSFDIISLWDVIEHLADPLEVLKCSHGLLKKGGLLFIHTPNGPIQLWKARVKKLIFGMRESGHYLEAKDHLHLYSQRGIERLLTRLGFSQVDFTHLEPIQSVSGNRSSLPVLGKNLWYRFSKYLHILSGGRLNMNNNLFVLAYK